MKSEMKRLLMMAVAIAALTLFFLLQAACDQSKFDRLLSAVGRIPATVSLPAQAREAIDNTKASLEEFRKGGNDARTWIAILDKWKGYIARRVFKVSSEQQAEMDRIVAAVGALMDDVQVPVGIKGSNAGAGDLQTEKAVVRLDEAKLRRLEELVR
jgi:hypothetical protein